MVSYKNLRRIVFEQELKWEVVKKGTGLTNETVAKINKDEYISLKSLEKLARYFNCRIGDLVDLKD
jgi:DNA-binding Xre family transcriptional regulator